MEQEIENKLNSIIDKYALVDKNDVITINYNFGDIKNVSFDNIPKKRTYIIYKFDKNDDMHKMSKHIKKMGSTLIMILDKRDDFSLIVKTLDVNNVNVYSWNKNNKKHGTYMTLFWN